jgi:hypothetical protein
MLDKFRELDNADVLEDDLLVSLYEAYMTASTEIFRVTFITSRRDLDIFIRSVKHKDRAARATLASLPGAKTFTYRTIMEEAQQLYLDLMESKLWTPAVAVKQDRGGAPMAFVCHEANNLIPNSPSGMNCYNCGKKGHVARDCPKPPKSGRSSGRGGGRGRARGRGGRGTDLQIKWPTWQREPPTSGQPEMRKHGEVTFYWCAVCKSWRTTHSTNGNPVDKVPKHTNFTKISGMENPDAKNNKKPENGGPNKRQ